MKKIYIIILLTAFSGLGEAIGQWAVSGNNIYNTNSGNVGIGSNTPGSLLYVSKFMTEPTVTIRNLGGSGGATFSMIDDASGANWKFKATLSGGFKIRDHAGSLDVIVVEPASMANALYIKSGGGVGIGTSSPGSALDVNGRNIELADWVFLGRMYNEADLLLGHNMKAIDYEDTRGAYVANDWPGGYSGIRMYYGDIQFHTKDGQVNAGDLATNERMRISADGNVGIGTGAPDNSALLEIASVDGGFLLPRMTPEQILAIPDPEDGLQVYCTTDHKIYIFVAIAGLWKEVAYGAGTLSPFTCGAPITVNNVAGTVAPVNKTVTYGTVLNIPGELTKCWITSNLGADQQATAVDDATEASAGWYWQFNRMQGYKHDGTNRTPNTAWIIDINENSDWLIANDPCALLLGAGWRLPTITEWANVDNSGSWEDWNGPWSSALKLHAAGYLYPSDGSLFARGSIGSYWSSVQGINSFGWNLYFFSGSCGMASFNKANGFTVRCLGDF